MKEVREVICHENVSYDRCADSRFDRDVRAGNRDANKKKAEAHKAAPAQHKEQQQKEQQHTAPPPQQAAPPPQVQRTRRNRPSIVRCSSLSPQQATASAATASAAAAAGNHPTRNPTSHPESAAGCPTRPDFREAAPATTATATATTADATSAYTPHAAIRRRMTAARLVRALEPSRTAMATSSNATQQVR